MLKWEGLQPSVRERDGACSLNSKETRKGAVTRQGPGKERTIARQLPGLSKVRTSRAGRPRGGARRVHARARTQWLRSAAPADARDRPHPVQAARNHIVHKVEQHLVQNLTGSTLEGVEV